MLHTFFGEEKEEVKTAIEEDVIKKKSPFDYSNSIDTKVSLRDDLNDYNKFMICKIYSHHNDTILISNEINKYSNLDNQMHYDFFFYMVSKRKRFAKWAKPTHNEDDLKMIMEYYKISFRKALEIIDLVDLNYIKESFYTGGRKK